MTSKSQQPARRAGPVRVCPRAARLACAGLAAAILLGLPTPDRAQALTPGSVPIRYGYPKLAVLRAGAAPADPVEIERLYRNWAMTDLLVFQGNRGKWWTHPRDAKGYSLRDYNPNFRILQYLAVDSFPVTPPTGSEIKPPPTDPEAALHASVFGRTQFWLLARAVGSSKFPVLAPLDPKWEGAIQSMATDGAASESVYANWNSPIFRDYVKQAMAEVWSAGFDGMFFDFGTMNHISFVNGHYAGMPPDCFRLKDSGWWYWMSYPGEYYQSYGPPPSIQKLMALDPSALSEIKDIDRCVATDPPLELSSEADTEAMIVDFYADLRGSSPILMIFNGANERSPRRNDVTLEHTDGGHKEGFALSGLTPKQIRQQMDMMESFGAKGRMFVGWIKSATNNTQALTFGYVACMMAGGPNTYCEFTDEIPAVSSIQLDPGLPSGHYVTLPAGETDLNRIVYKRTWTRADMYLNPTTTAITVEGVAVPAGSGLVVLR